MVRCVERGLVVFGLIVAVQASAGCAPALEENAEEAEADFTLGGYLETTIEATNIEQAFRQASMTGRSEITFTKTASTVDLRTTHKGKGLLETPFAPPRNTSTKTDTTVPGEGKAKGHSTLTLTQILGKPTKAQVSVDEVLELEDDGSEGEVPSLYTAEMTFTKGSWSELVGGNAIELEPTANGMADLDKARQLAFTASMRNLADRLTRELPGKTIATPIVVDQFKAHDRGTIRGSKTELRLVNSRGTLIKMHFSVSTTTS
jgi:hypothetical protein